MSASTLSNPRCVLRTQFADVSLDAIEAVIHFSEAPIDRRFESVEMPVNLFEAEIDPFRELVDAFFGASLDHGP
jgi:UDP-glucose 4-epimerase